MTTIVKPELGRQEDVLDRLALIEPGDHRVVSCFFSFTPEYRAGSRYLAELKNQVRRSWEELAPLGLDHAETEALERDFKRITDVVSKGDRVPDAPGLAIYACEALDLLVAVPLPQPCRPRLVVDRVPHLALLHATALEFGRVITVVLDRVHGRLFEVDAWKAVELPGDVAEATRGGRFHSSRHESPGSGERHYHLRIARERERHYATLAHRLKDLDRSHPINGIVIAGQIRDVSGLTHFLNDSLSRRLLGTARLDLRSVTPALIRDLTFKLYGEHERNAEETRMDELARREGEGWAVNGVQATMRALARGQLRTLLVRADTEAAEADEAIEDALAQHVSVILIHAPENAGRLQHLGGFLRFR